MVLSYYDRLLLDGNRFNEIFYCEIVCTCVFKRKEGLSLKFVGVSYDDCDKFMRGHEWLGDCILVEVLVVCSYGTGFVECKRSSM